MKRTSVLIPPVAAALPTPASLPPVGDPLRWPALKRLRHQSRLDPRPWLEAIEMEALPLQADLVASLADHLDGEAACRLLDCWRRDARRDPAIPSLLGHCREVVWANRLRDLLRGADAQDQIWLLPLLGHQRDRDDFGLLRARLVEPGPLACRLAALEALSVGLRAWHRPLLRETLCRVVGDLEPRLAGAALDLLARLPGARADLLKLSLRRFDPAVEQRLRRRLDSLPAAPLLLLVHGRSGGAIPEELRTFAAELAQCRGAEVRLQALTDPAPPPVPRADPLAPPTTLVPLLLLPGGHVCHDLPALVAALGRRFPLRRLPFLGSWPDWQAALAREVAALDCPGTPPPLLLHHPLSGPLAERYLTLLARRCGAECRPAGFDPSAGGADLAPARQRGFLPLALAANRLTERLQAEGCAQAALPLLARPRLRRALQQALLALP